MTLIPAIALGLLAALLLAAPVGAASTGTICGEVTAFTAPTAVADGSLTIDGSAAAEAAGAWLTLAGLGLIGSGAGLIVLGRRNRLGR